MGSMENSSNLQAAESQKLTESKNAEQKYRYMNVRGSIKKNGREELKWNSFSISEGSFGCCIILSWILN